MSTLCGLKRELLRVFIAALILATNYVHAAEPSPFGTFSNMHQIESESDIVGIEILVMHAADGCYVLFQSAEGEPRKPKLLKCELRGDELVFVLPPDPNDYHGTFKGRISAKGIMGKFDSGQVNFDLRSEFFLPRKNSFWQRRRPNS